MGIRGRMRWVREGLAGIGLGREAQLEDHGALVGNIAMARRTCEGGHWAGRLRLFDVGRISFLEHGCSMAYLGLVLLDVFSNTETAPQFGLHGGLHSLCTLCLGCTRIESKR